MEEEKKGDCPNCGGQSVDELYLSQPPQKRCKDCGQYWYCNQFIHSHPFTDSNIQIIIKLLSTRIIYNVRVIRYSHIKGRNPKSSQINGIFSCNKYLIFSPSFQSILRPSMGTAIGCIIITSVVRYFPQPIKFPYQNLNALLRIQALMENK